MNDIPISVISGIVGLLLVAAFSAILFRRINFPYTIGLVLVGILLFALGGHFRSLEIMRHIHLTPNIILYILLPTLVFDAAINIDSRLLMKNLTPVLVLAAPGLVVATLVTGGIIAWLTPLSLGGAMLFGALISATDPVAVIALFKELGAPKRLTMLVDGESLFNDATAIVAFNIVMGIVIGGAWSASVLSSAAVNFVMVFAGGTLVGALIGYVMIQIIRMAGNDPLIEIAFSTVVAYAAFILANYYLQLSGVMAAVGAGLVVNYYSATRLTPEVRQYLKQFWGYASFVANSFIFLMIGLTEEYLAKEMESIPRILGYVGAAVVAIMVSRAAIVFLMVPLLNRMPRSEPVDWRNQLVMFWGGLRGALPIGLAVSLAPDFPGRALIIQLTLGVVLFTLLVQGTTIKGLMKKLKLTEPSLSDRIARLSALEAATRSGLQRIEQTDAFAENPNAPDIEKVREHYRGVLEKTRQELQEMLKGPAQMAQVRRETLWLQTNSIEHQTLTAIFEQGFVSEKTLRELEQASDIRRGQIQKGMMPPPGTTYTPVRLRLLSYFARQAKSQESASGMLHRLEFKDLISRMERHGASRIVARHVLSELSRLADLCDVDESTRQACQAYYEGMKEQGRQQMEQLAKESPEAFRFLRLRTMRHAGLIAEKKAVEQLQQNGAIPEKVAGVLYDEMNELLKRTSSCGKLDDLTLGMDLSRN